MQCPKFRLGLRAAIAMILTLAVCFWLHVPRDYWAILTVLLVIAPALGESIYKASRRLSMTIIGCAIGTVLYMLLPNLLWLNVLIAFITLFLGLYWITTSYTISVFWISIFVVFIFGTLMKWDITMLGERILAVSIACTIAIVVSAVCFPERSEHHVGKQLPGFLTEIQSILADFLAVSFAGTLPGAIYVRRLNEIGEHNAALRNHLAHAQYEVFLRKKRRRQLNQALRHVDILIGYVTSLCSAAYQLHETKLPEALLASWTQQCDALKQQFARTIEHAATLSSGQDGQLNSCADKVMPAPLRIHEWKSSLNSEQLLAITACLYYFACIQKELRIIADL